MSWYFFWPVSSPTTESWKNNKFSSFSAQWVDNFIKYTQVLKYILVSSAQTDESIEFNDAELAKIDSKTMKSIFNRMRYLEETVHSLRQEVNGVKKELKQLRTEKHGRNLVVDPLSNQIR